MLKFVPDYAQQIDARTHDLMLEFFDHVREVQKLPPKKHDPRKIFEGWAIQKIAGLQFSVLQLGDQLNRLERRVSRTRRPGCSSPAGSA